MAKAECFLRIPWGLALGALAFWMGLGRLIFMSTRLTVDVMKGQHPHDVLTRMSRERAERP